MKLVDEGQFFFVGCEIDCALPTHRNIEPTLNCLIDSQTFTPPRLPGFAESRWDDLTKVPDGRTRGRTMALQQNDAESALQCLVGEKTPQHSATDDQQVCTLLYRHG